MKLYNLLRDGEVLFTGTENACFRRLQIIQPQSADWAMTWEGYTVEPVDPLC